MESNTKVKQQTVSILSLALFTVFVTGVSLRLVNFHISRRSPDELIYTSQARIIAKNGIQGTKELVVAYLKESRLWIYPPPTRIGYLIPLSAFMRITNDTNESAGAKLSFFFNLIAMGLLVIFGLKFFTPGGTLYALLFLSVSPMDIAIARRAWQDALLGCIGFFLIYICCEIMARANNRKRWYLLFVALGSWCILIKESGSIIYGLCALWVLWFLFYKERNFVSGSLLILGIVIGSFFSVALLAYACGGVNAIFAVLRHVKEAMPTNIYALEYQTGAWYNLLQGFWILTPFNALFCPLGMATLLHDTLRPNSKERADNKRRYAFVGLVFFSVSFVCIASLAPYCQSLRYVSVLYIPFYLISGYGFQKICYYLQPLLRSRLFYFVLTVLVIIVLGEAFFDYMNFTYFFNKQNLCDISIGLLKEASR